MVKIRSIVDRVFFSLRILHVQNRSRAFYYNTNNTEREDRIHVIQAVYQFYVGCSDVGATH